MDLVSKSPWWWIPHRRWRIVATIPEADEVPDNLPSRGVVVVALSGSNAKWLVFDCPCGAERIMINTDTRRAPAWRLWSSPVRGVTIQPSIDSRHDRGRCHYLIRHGRTIWVPERNRAKR